VGDPGGGGRRVVCRLRARRTAAALFVVRVAGRQAARADLSHGGAAVSTRLPASNCLNCGKKLDGAEGVQGGEPGPGCLSICVYCGAVTIYGDDLHLRPLTEDEAAKLAQERDTMRLLRKATRLIHFYKAARN
jgi:hypothetical protein